MTDSGIDDDEVEGLKQVMKDSCGPGNFTIFSCMHRLRKKDGLQLIPISELAAKDEFLNIKNVTRDDVLASQRTPRQLLGIIPSNAGGFGSIKEARESCWYSEIVPEQNQIAHAINEWAGDEIVGFKTLGEVNPTS